MIDHQRFFERRALLTRLNRLSDALGTKVGGFTSWGEVWVAGPARRWTYGKHDPVTAANWCASPEHEGIEYPQPRQLGFGHMDRIAREMKRP